MVKDFVRKGRIVPLCDDTLKLLQHLGFTHLETVHALLTQETREADLFTGHSTKTKSRKSFFRRLAESKGSPPIDHETVLFCMKPGSSP